MQSDSAGSKEVRKKDGGKLMSKLDLDCTNPHQWHPERQGLLTAHKHCCNLCYNCNRDIDELARFLFTACTR